MSHRKKEFTDEWQSHCEFLQQRIDQLNKDEQDAAEEDQQIRDFIQVEKSRMKSLLGFLQRIDVDKLFNN
jgi:hypothetical protein